jgi:plasmid stabilization system protein ParE
MIKWTPKSVNDLDEITDYIAKKFSIDLAIKTVHGLVSYVDKILNFNPLAGKIVENNPLFFKIVFEGNSIYYCEYPKDKNIYIVYVRARGTIVKDDRLNNKEAA